MQLVKQLHDAKAGIPVIVLTVPQNPVSVEPDKGIDDVLSMPFNGYDLMSKITGVHKVATAATDRGPSRLLVVFAPKGGVGKTTIAFNVAVAAAGLGARTALIDGSIQFGDLRGLLRAPRDAPSMLDLPTDRISETDLADVLWRGPAGVDILLAPPRIEMAEMVLIRDLEKTHLAHAPAVRPGHRRHRRRARRADARPARPGGHDPRDRHVRRDDDPEHDRDGRDVPEDRLPAEQGEVHRQPRRLRPRASTRPTFGPRSGASPSSRSAPRARSSGRRATRAPRS